MFPSQFLLNQHSSLSFLREELKTIKFDIIDLSEVKRKGTHFSKVSLATDSITTKEKPHLKRVWDLLSTKNIFPTSSRFKLLDFELYT